MEADRGKHLVQARIARRGRATPRSRHAVLQRVAKLRAALVKGTEPLPLLTAAAASSGGPSGVAADCNPGAAPLRRWQKRRDTGALRFACVGGRQGSAAARIALGEAEREAQAGARCRLAAGPAVTRR